MAGEKDEPQVVAPQTGPVPLEAAPVAEVAAIAEAPVVAAEVVAEAPIVEAAPVAEVPPTVAETPSLLEGAALEEAKPEVVAEGEKPAEEKPIEAPKEGEKPADGEQPKPEEKPAELAAVDYKFELPEGFNLPDDQKTAFTGLLDGFRKEPGNVQPLVDFHVAEVGRVIERVALDQHRVFNDTRKQWRDQIKGDEEFGGAGFETSTKAVARMRDLLVSSHPVGTPEYDRQAKEANDFFRITGAGDHPVLWRILHNAARFFDEAPLPPSNINPAPGGRAPNGSKRSMLYDNPTSPNNRG